MSMATKTKSSNRLTKYEWTTIIGTRAYAITQGSPLHPLLSLPSPPTKDPIEIA
jgi:DNA-directed RNA polymerase subunit K/omega